MGGWGGGGGKSGEVGLGFGHQILLKIEEEKQL